MSTCSSISVSVKPQCNHHRRRGRFVCSQYQKQVEAVRGIAFQAAVSLLLFSSQS